MDFSATDTEADIRLDRAALIEVPERVDHARPNARIAVDQRTNNIGEIFRVIETIAGFSFQTQAVLERVTKAKMLRPIRFVIGIAVQTNRTNNGHTIFDIAVKRITDIGTSRP